MRRPVRSDSPIETQYALLFNAAVVIAQQSNAACFSQTWSDMQSQLGQGLKHDIIHTGEFATAPPPFERAGGQAGSQQANAPKCEMDLAKTQLCVHDQIERERI